MANDLVLKNISKNYGGVHALKNVSLSFHAGEVHALIGENGAGKSTLIKTISGVTQPSDGSIEFFGEELKNMTPIIAIEKGIAVVHQELIQFEGMTVADNVCMKESVIHSGFVDQKAINNRTEELLAMFETNIKPSDKIANLSVAERQIVEIAKAINLNAKVVIFDEPTASITTQEQEKLFKLIKSLKKQGILVIYISHRLEELAEICDRISVLRDGEYIATYDMKDITIPKMIELMVGRELGDIYIKKQPCQNEVVLKLEHVSGNGVTDISFELHRGEILGFAGLVGAGRTELMEVIYGAAKKDKGKIYLHGKELELKSPEDAIANGIALIPEDRKNQGLFLDKSIMWNVTISSMKRLSKSIFRNFSREREETKKYKNMLSIKMASMDCPPSSLSGGNQQKVVLAKAMSTNPDILIFDEPTRGVDVGARNEIYQIMVDLANQGKSILMVSSDMSELIGMSERIIILYEGKQTGELGQEDFKQDLIMSRASGI